MVENDISNKCGKKVYKAIRKYASFVNGQSSACGTPCKKLKTEEKENESKVIGKLYATEDFIDFVCCGFKSEMAKEFFLKDLHVPLIEGDLLNCETPPDSLPDIKPFFNSSHTTATIKKEKCLQKLVKNDKNKKKINGLNSTFNNNKRLTVLKKINLKVNRINEFSDKNSLTKNRKNHITSKNFLGSEKSSMKSNGGKECLKKRLRASTIALSSASCKEHFKTISTNMLHRKSLDLLDKRTRSKQNNIKENYNGISNHLNVTLNGNSAEQTLTSKLRNIMNKKLNVTPSMINGKLKNSINDTSGPTEKASLLKATEADFSNIPIFINKLCQQQLPLYHVCPPSSFKVECTVPQQIRFATHNQYVHRFSNRWGYNSTQLACITAHLDSQSSIFNSHPLVGGVEVDLVALMEAIRQHGGLQKVIDKHLWTDVVKCICVPVCAKDKVSRFYEIYCRHLLSYDTLPNKDKLKLLKSINDARFSETSDNLCVSKGRCRNLGELYAVARNVASMMRLEDATNQQVLHRYWRVVREASPHTTVNTAFIKPSDVNNCRKNRSFKCSRKDLTSLMRCCTDGLCPLFADEEVIDSRLEVEMMFSTRCWSKDQHNRGLITYNHTGADVVWYCIRGEDEALFKDFLSKKYPQLINDHQKKHWLPPNHIMVCPQDLVQGGLKVYSCTQTAGHLVIIPPSSFFSSVSCGYSISEHAHFLPHNWLQLAVEDSKSLHESHVVPMFSIERFLMALLTREVHLQQQQLKRHLSEPQIKQAFNLLNQVICREVRLRKVLLDGGVKRRMDRVMEGGEMVGCDAFMTCLMQHKLSICSLSKAFCFFSKTQDTHSNKTLCIECAHKRIQAGTKASHFETTIYFNHSELQELLSKVRKTFNLPKEVPLK